LTKAPRRYDGEKTASSTIIAGKSGYLPLEARGNTLEEIGLDKEILSRTQVAQQLRENMDK
jgi:hypothetical protein